MLRSDAIKLSGSEVQESDLFPASLIKNHEDLKKYEEITGFELMLYSDVCQVAEETDIDPSNIYFLNSGDSFSPYVYYSFPAFVELFQVSKGFIEDFKVKKAIEHQKKTLKEYLDEQNYGLYFYHIHTKIRISALHKIYDTIPNEDKYNVFLHVYVSGNYGFSNYTKELLEDAFSKQPEDVKQTLRHELNKISSGNEITIYRGSGKYATPLDKALSWTLNLRVADTFANRFVNGGTIYAATVKKEKIVDYIVDANEDEIIVRPEDVENIEILDMVDVNDELDLMGDNGYIYHYHKFLNKLDRKLFMNPDGLHGYSHTQRVLLNALSLCNAYELDDLETTKICLAAVYHDIGRDNDEEDEIHGRKSWEKLIEMDLIPQLEEEFELYEDDLETIKFLMEYHCLEDKVAWENVESVNEGRHTDELRFLVKLFKDADGLDRVRLKDLDSRYLRLDESKKRVNFAQQLLNSFR